MPSPFPGMDPYLEAPELWPDVHHELLSVLRELLNPRLRPGHFARISGFGVLLGDSDALVEENIVRPCINVIERTSRSTVAVIVVLSPGTKAFRSASRESYQIERERLLKGSTSLVEIDLLRAGQGFLQHPAPTARQYRVILSDRRRAPELWCWEAYLGDRLPKIPVPLGGGECDVLLDLQAAITAVYDRGAFDLRNDYHLDPLPPLTSYDEQWIARMLRERGLRQ